MQATDIAHVIQLAVAPVFLLTGIGALMSVLSARVAYWVISLCTACALLICTLIVILFVGAFLSLDVSSAIAILFIAAMAALIIGLYCFLHEIYPATASLRFRWRSRTDPDKGRVVRIPSPHPGQSPITLNPAVAKLAWLPPPVRVVPPWVGASQSRSGGQSGDRRPTPRRF